MQLPNNFPKKFCLFINKLLNLMKKFGNDLYIKNFHFIILEIIFLINQYFKHVSQDSLIMKIL